MENKLDSDQKPSEEEGQMTEKQKRIAELKKNLLAPSQPKKYVTKKEAAPEVDMEKKFDRVMDHGTPRLVVGPRSSFQMDTRQMAARNKLQQIAGLSKPIGNEPKQEFT